jgi:hypothetical protein
MLLRDELETTLAPRRPKGCVAASSQATGGSSVQKRMASDVRSRAASLQAAAGEAAYRQRADGFYETVCLFSENPNKTPCFYTAPRYC